jgi:hypothetical protein
MAASNNINNLHSFGKLQATPLNFVSARQLSKTNLFLLPMQQAGHDHSMSPGFNIGNKIKELLIFIFIFHK